MEPKVTELIETENRFVVAGGGGVAGGSVKVVKRYTLPGV